MCVERVHYPEQETFVRMLTMQNRNVLLVKKHTANSVVMLK